MCCPGMVLVRTLAAEFCAYCVVCPGFTWNPRQDSIAAVHPGCHKGMHGSLCYRVGQRREVVASRFGDGLDAGLNGDGVVKDNTLVGDLRGWSDGTAINSDEEISNVSRAVTCRPQP